MKFLKIHVVAITIVMKLFGIFKVSVGGNGE